MPPTLLWFDDGVEEEEDDDPAETGRGTLEWPGGGNMERSVLGDEHSDPRPAPASFHESQCNSILLRSDTPVRAVPWSSVSVYFFKFCSARDMRRRSSFRWVTVKRGALANKSLWRSCSVLSLNCSRVDLLPTIASFESGVTPTTFSH